MKFYARSLFYKPSIALQNKKKKNSKQESVNCANYYAIGKTIHTKVTIAVPGGEMRSKKLGISYR